MPLISVRYINESYIIYDFRNRGIPQEYAFSELPRKTSGDD